MESILKIAILMAGGFRTHWKERCWKSFKDKLLDKYDCDLYISTSSVEHQSGDVNKISEFYPHAKINYINDFPKDNFSEYMKNMFSPENMGEHSSDGKSPVFEDFIQYISFYRVYDAWKMMEQSNIDYDIIIKTRPDLEYRGDFPNFVFEPSHICWIYQHPCKSINDLQYDDRFAIGSYEIMKHYCDLFNQLDVIKGGKILGEKISKYNLLLRNEHMLFCHMEDYKVVNFHLNTNLEENLIFWNGTIQANIHCSSMEIIREYDTDNAPSTNEECLPLYNEWKNMHFRNLKTFPRGNKPAEFK